jgi:calcineurin-like phosphoesterase family protein
MKYTSPVLKAGQPDDNYKFQPLPAPTGNYPYHLAIENFIPGLTDTQMVFHMLGDTGGTSRPEFQQYLVAEIAKQHLPGQFIYHLGDLVYHFGEVSQYEQQFFRPYNIYPGPVFAIAGNHDSDVNTASAEPYQSLDAFTRVFCDTKPQEIIFSGNSSRKSMTQPNVYWSLETPLATIIGLHSNVPKFGVITPEQQSWFKEELKIADPAKMLIVCIHHAPYSADINHGSSLAMIAVLESAFAETGIRPDIVFSGHVHNYQRFTKTYSDGVTVPFIVAGAGGFDELHAVADTSDPNFTSESPVLEGVKLENYCYSHHGFLRISINKTQKQLSLSGEYYKANTTSAMPASLSDSFVICKNY